MEEKGEKTQRWEPAPPEAWEEIENSKRDGLDLRKSESSPPLIPYFEYVQAVPSLQSFLIYLTDKLAIYRYTCL